MNTPHRTRAAVGLAALASLAVIGGTLASFTDSDTTTEQVMTAGTVNIDLVEGAGWADNLDNLAVDDTFTRTVLLDNTSTLPLGSARISSTLTDTVGEFGGRLSEAVAVDIIQVEGNVQLANDVRLADLADGYNLVFAGGRLAPATDVNLRFAYEVVGARTNETGNRSKGARELPVNPDNKYQGSSLRVAYTLDAVQRAGIEVGTAAAPETFNAVRDANNVTLSFTNPSTNPAGTVYTATWTPVTAPAAAPVAAFAARTAPTSAAAAPAGSMSATSGPMRITGLDWDTTYTFTLTATGPNGVTSAPLDNNVVIPRQSGVLRSWGYTASPITNTPVGATEFVQVATGWSHAVALSPDGTVTAWGGSQGISVVPPSVSSRTVKYIDAGPNHNLVVFADGTVGGWGDTGSGRLNIPAGLSDVVAVSAGSAHSLALKSNGTVVQWGGSGWEESVPAGLNNVVQIVAGNLYSYAVRADGTTVAWGYHNGGIMHPSLNTGIKQIALTSASGQNGGIALRTDGTVFAFGSLNYGQASVPNGLSGVKHIDVSKFVATAVKADGTIRVWGDSRYGTDVPTNVHGVLSAAAPDFTGGVIAIGAAQ